ncbi:PEP-CTERM sorting domain-containing protein [Novosphingobium sp. 1949]|uniref:PEP-CTERM sorting domain-containing protein n=1 Tax=Novosphingobium organovorum TaxID=2930092 RepID=A0ABT0BF85_9SPHN|nr:PEP-CTERM sorting domain-containing protein [Novosphingobium organovorum]MCJ2183741.1 PEP-CTERM sorting domain-containing protein [Novosphingobium organovorum]
MRLIELSTAAAAIFLPANAAFAQGGVTLPEPSGLLLLALGMAGVVIGRRFSRGRGKD